MNRQLAVAFRDPLAAPPVSSVAHAALERMLEHFFSDAVLVPTGRAPKHASLDMAVITDRHLAFNWFGTRYGFAREELFSVLERLLIQTRAWYRFLDVLE